ncbi:MAG TPA: MarR family transcriptional regulator [Acidobacteriaceae bacterium]|jgi:DNA-binding MarR family transcriptional regulator|nr:MarR family transcriptional regulator [Acidobacteriaceae bacterium]
MSTYQGEKAKSARRCSQTLRELLGGYRALLEDSLREEGLTLPQLRLLKAIREQHGLSGRSIARTCQVTPQTLQAMLTRAVREGWITREASESNHRIVTASLTRDGEELLAHGLAMAAEIEAKVWAGISVSALDVVNDTLDRALANLNEELARSRALQ